MLCNRTRVLIADDHKLVAELCKKLLEPEYDVVGIVTNGRELLDSAGKLQPHVIVLDIGMPLLNGLDAGKKIKQVMHGVKLVYLTMNTDPELALAAFEWGASGYLLKNCAAVEIIAAVRDALKGKSYLSPILKPKVTQLRWERKRMLEEADRLTERQREVLQLLAEGKVMKEVGDILKMTPRTVAFHKYRMMEALGTKNNADLVRYAVRNHIIPA